MKKHLKFASIAVSFLLIGAGCPTAPPVSKREIEPPQQEETMPIEGATSSAPVEKEPPAEAMKKEEKTVSLEPYYIAYSSSIASEARSEGRATVYYFWTAGDATCRMDEPNIKSWIESSNLPIAGFRVNFDAQADLKTRYKVASQHTAIFLNKKGEEVERFDAPVAEAAFRAALKKASQ